MASRPLASARSPRIPPGLRFRMILRRSVARSGELAGALALWALMAFLLLALVSYSQTDPSGSTAAGGPVGNWMGAKGAWAADALLLAFGPAAILLLPLCHVLAVRLWQLAEAGEATATPAAPAAHPHWGQSLAHLFVAVLLLASVTTIAFHDATASLPAGAGGLTGMMGAGAIHRLTGLLPVGLQGLAVGLAGIACLIGGVWLAARVFALNLAGLFALPFALPEAISARAAGEATRLPRLKKPRPAAPIPEATPRRAPAISDAAASAAPAEIGPRARQGDLFAQYALPDIALLAEATANPAARVDKGTLESNARLLETVLADFKVRGAITGVRTGPVVTMYELEPEAGTKAARVIALAHDIARNMSAVSARVSSIPGRTVMGIELPNANRQTVNFRELVGCEAFASHKGLLPIILGKNIAGEPVVADLAAMPHLLVAGTTGAGKSVGLNAILLSLLYRLTPAECRLILVDPKVLELKSYDDIPHLLAPVVTEPAKAVRALKWAVEEMERRYRMMSEIGVRNLSGFNEKVASHIARNKPLGRRVAVGFDPDSGEEIVENTQLDYAELPQIVVIVDELADLMVTVGKEIEVLIQRLSQKSRAAGIHLIMATQRPSVDVITGVIKANLPTRISFAVTSRIDSATILGEQGAEQLLGKGDMLYKPSASPLIRVHGPFVSDEEVERVADHWRAQGSPDYVTSVTEEPEDGLGMDFGDATLSDSPEERKYAQACAVVFQSQKASTSWLQRHMGVGYNSAAKWIERMEADGLVGPANHVGRREIYRDRDGNVL